MRATAAASLVVSFTLAALAVSCGDNLHGVPPDAPPADAMVAAGFCGDDKVEPGEQCDDGTGTTDVFCDSMCQFTCGNGVVDTSVGETCDTGIPSGTGACPTSCDDGDACTTDVMSGSDCTTTCINTPITMPIDGDGCCPTGANANTDSDCAAMCGNGVLEPGEVCDTGIAAGKPGACPTSCDDGVACTTDTLNDPGTCQASCSHTTITKPINGDGCCPAGATHATDTDCPAACGDGVVETGETCDTGIAAGKTGACPTSCNDGMACTTDTLVSGGTCEAACTYTPITKPINGDGCCPTGANANTDTDCKPVCGNGIVEPGEQCDDGNTNPNDGCANCMIVPIPPTAFRMSDLDLRDPHVFVNFIGCRDVTDTELAGFSVNNALQTDIQGDANGDGDLDLSIVMVFRPLAQASATSSVDIDFATCTAPMASTKCDPGTGTKISTTATNMTGGQCLAAIAGTTHPYTPAITNTSGPCFVTSPVTVTISLGGIPITLTDARLAGTYVGSPATSLTNGLLMGFISQSVADATIIPTTFPLVGGKPLSSLLAGGTNACPSYSDMDTDNGVKGWWFYLNFPATQVTWSDN